MPCWGSLSPDYFYRGESNKLADARCQSIPGHGIDQAVGDLLVEAMSPAALDVSLAVGQELQERIEDADRVRRRQLERVRYEAELARQRFMRVSPENRLVANSLEAEWIADERYQRLVPTDPTSYPGQAKSVDPAVDQLLKSAPDLRVQSAVACRHRRSGVSPRA